MILSPIDLKEQLYREFDLMQATFRQLVTSIEQGASPDERNALRTQLELRAENVTALSRSVKAGRGPLAEAKDLKSDDSDELYRTYLRRLAFLEDQGYSQGEALAHLKDDLAISEEVWQSLVKRSTGRAGR